jgi:hypothetical protein
MTNRLYYHDSFLYDFDAEVREVTEGPAPRLDSRPLRLLSALRASGRGIIADFDEKQRGSRKPFEIGSLLPSLRNDFECDGDVSPVEH